MRQLWPLQPNADPLATYAHRPAVEESVLNGSVIALGKAFVSAEQYVLPFEIASVLMLGAMVGAVVVAWPKPEDEE
jgi:NADH:ubiquinone oxidoreductase subunit 6 (subunit J)